MLIPCKYPNLCFIGLWITLNLVSSVQGHEDVIGSVDSQQLLHLNEPNLNVAHDNGSDFGPWSYKPVCSQHYEQIGDKLCVYTSTNFASGRGISAFTTPRISKWITSTEPFQESHLLAGLGVNPAESSWAINSIAGKGLGMFAKAGITRGESITGSTPVLIAHTEAFLPKAERENFLRIAVDRLPAPARDAFLDLSRLFDRNGTQLQGIVSGNAFELQLSDTGHLAVFPEASRINHACMPNAQFHTNSALLTHRVHAVRSIEEGEEITIAYSSPLEKYAVRQQQLRNAFQFTCRCLRCQRGEAADEALDEIQELQMVLADWGPQSQASVKKAERLVKLFHQEGLEGFIDPAYCHAALTYSAAGSLRGAQKYINLAIEAHKLRLGPTAQDLGACNGMLTDLQSHWSWRRRKSS